VRQHHRAQVARLAEQETGKRKVAGRDKHRSVWVSGEHRPDRRRSQHDVADMVRFDDSDLHGR
jgi:hypothetical protein